MSGVHWDTLDVRVTWLWRAQGLLRSVFGLLPFWLGFGVGLGFLVSPRVAVVAVLVGMTLAVVQAVVWPELAYRAFRYAVRADALIVQHGVWWQHTVAIARDRIQHVDLRQGPLERAWGLTTLVVYTAAGLHADGSIPGLTSEEAERLRDLLVATPPHSDDGV